MNEVYFLLDDEDFGLSEGEDSDFEGEEVCGYRPEVRPRRLLGEDGDGDAREEDDEAMEVGSGSARDEGGMDSELSKSTPVEARHKNWEGESCGSSRSSSSPAPSSSRGSSTLELLSPASSSEPSTGGEVDSLDSDSSGSGREHRCVGRHRKGRGRGHGRGKGRRIVI